MGGFVYGARKHGLLRGSVLFAALVAALGIALINISNAELIRMFGKPLSFGLLYYSDVLGSENGRLSVLSWIPAQLIYLVACAILCALISHLILRALLLRRPKLIFGVVAALTACVLIIGWADDGFAGDLDHAYTQSGTYAFVKSLRILGTDSLLTSVKNYEGPPIGPEMPGIKLSAPMASEKPIGNVILIVLESTAAQYLDQYGGPYAVTPNLTKLEPHSVIITNAYAQSVASHISLGVLLTARNPLISLRSITSEKAHTNIVTLPQLLTKEGVRTAFFHSSDTRHSGVDKFLAHSGFQLVQDYRQRPCPDGHLNDRSEFNSLATSDRCTFASLTRWISANRAEPFFAMLWTFQTHYPYFRVDESRKVKLQSELANDPWAFQHKQRYLGALAEADELIGELVKELRLRGLDDKTLIIVTGDHGEAFEQHGSFGHGASLYEEDVHVPLILINATLGSQRRFARLTGHLDVAPTVADWLRLKTPASWKGTSLFRPRKEQPVYFFTSWLDLSIGRRFGSEKVVGHLLDRSVERYDLSHDPAELNGNGPDTAADEKALSELTSWAGRTNFEQKSGGR
jgi:arylsulfatase A-like enzyme